MSAWRVGRKVGRTIYAQLGPEPSDTDPLIGVMDTRELALLAVEGHNESEDIVHVDVYGAWTMRPGDDRPELRYPAVGAEQ